MAWGHSGGSDSFGVGNDYAGLEVPSGLRGINEAVLPQAAPDYGVSPTLQNITNFITQGRLGNSRLGLDFFGRRVNFDQPLTKVGPGLLSTQGSYSPYGNNYIGFTWGGRW